jgi:hypothetical protein
LDDSRTLERARHFRAFRIMDVQAGAQGGGALLFTEEHEIRSSQHSFISLPQSVTQAQL